MFCQTPCAENDKINELDEPYFGTHILSDSLPSQTFEIPKKNTQPLISTRGLGCSGHQKSESFKTELQSQSKTNPRMKRIKIPEETKIHNNDF